MARPLRIEYPNAVYHITSRGNIRGKIYKDDKDRQLFIETLGSVIKRYNWLCHAYCLMRNKVSGLAIDICSPFLYNLSTSCL